MRIVIFHYHLDPGGVTSIIIAQIKALITLQKDIEITLLTGRYDEQSLKFPPQVKIIVDKSLNYQTDTSVDYKHEISCIIDLFKQNCSKADIIHAHNPNLGKNPSLTVAIFELAKEGYTIINHAHDFSEDRPANHIFLQTCIHKDLGLELINIMYPELPNYQFVVLNTSDKNRLLSYNINELRVHLLPNPAQVPECNKKSNNNREEICNELGLDKTKLIITYPVRVIQRKNIGEFILLACLFEDKANWVVTQPPKNPVEVKPYSAWKDFCQQTNLKICWEAGNKTSFSKLVSVSDFCISTSYQEGFGLSFIEPWLYSTPVIGRDIPMVTMDLRESGIQFPCLYSHLLVEEQKEMHHLDISKQMDIILKCKTDKLFRIKLFDRNNYLKDLLNPVEDSLIKKNIEVILKEYSLENFGQRLYDIYRRIIK